MTRKLYSYIKKGAVIMATVLMLTPLIHAQQRTLPQLKITYKEDALNYFTYIPGTMELTDVDGTTVSLPTQFKTRGATARRYVMKPSLNMKLRDAEGNELDTDLLGLRKASSFILDAMAIDRINMRNRVAFDIWNSFSRLPYETEFGSRNGTVGKYVEMTINGNYKGIYCLSDKINRKLLDLKKPEIDGAGNATIRGLLWKHGTNDVADQNTPGFFNDYTVWVAEYHDAWELHEPEEYASEAAWAPLVEFYSGNNRSDYSYIKEHFWLENLADYTIHVMALGIQDNWGNKNKYFSIQNVTKEGDKRRIVVTPWDLDCALGGHYDGDFYDGTYTSWSLKSIANNAPIPIGTCLGQQDFKSLLKERWLTGRAGAFAVDSVKQRLYDTCDLFEESGAWQRTVNLWSGKGEEREKYVEDLRKEVGLIASWYERRFREMDEYFNVTQEDIDGAGITDVAPDTSEEAIYTIHGIRVKGMVSPGIYIKGGRKVLIK